MSRHGKDIIKEFQADETDEVINDAVKYLRPEIYNAGRKKNSFRNYNHAGTLF